MKYSEEQLQTLAFEYEKDLSEPTTHVYKLVSVVNKQVYNTDMWLTLKESEDKDTIEITHVAALYAPDIDSVKTIVREFTGRPMLEAVYNGHGFTVTLGIKGADKDISNYWGFDAEDKGFNITIDRSEKPVETTAKSPDYIADADPSFGFNKEEGIRE